MRGLRPKFVFGLVASAVSLFASGSNGDEATAVCFGLFGAALIIADAIDGVKNVNGKQE